MTDLSGDVGVDLEVGHHLQDALVDRRLALATALQRGGSLARRGLRISKRIESLDLQ